MSFQQKNQSKERDFLEKNFEALIKNGLPIAIAEDPKNWLFFLEHGYHPEALWNKSELSKQQLKNLIVLLEEFDETVFILYNLRNRVQAL